MMSSTGSVPAQRIPAWKKLGLKLKQPADASEPAPANGSSLVGHPGGPTGHKRKVDAPPPANAASPLKKARRDGLSGDRNASTSTPSSLKPKKTVKFGDTPTKNDITSPAAKHPTNKASKDTQTKKSKGPAKKQKPQPAADIKPALEYLRHWKSSRETWKFNKNHQSTLIRHFFDPKEFPASDVDAFYEYIRDLKGFVRTRLLETAMEIKMKDESDGAAGFSDSSMDIDDERQSKYDSILADILRRRQNQNGAKRKYYSEAQYVAESPDGDVIIRRVVKRMRSELVIEEVSDSGESTDTTSSSKTVTGSDGNNTTTTTASEAGKRTKLNDGSGKRRRKLRVNMDDSSSSESESESGSGSSSSSSSEDSDSEDEEDGQQDNGWDTSSSSSSSSSSGGSDSEEESEDDD